jgi:hypothetical protein
MMVIASNVGPTVAEWAVRSRSPRPDSLTFVPIIALK